MTVSIRKLPSAVLLWSLSAAVSWSLTCRCMYTVCVLAGSSGSQGGSTAQHPRAESPTAAGACGAPCLRVTLPPLHTLPHVVLLWPLALCLDLRSAGVSVRHWAVPCHVIPTHRCTSNCRLQPTLHQQTCRGVSFPCAHRRGRSSWSHESTETSLLGWRWLVISSHWS